MKSEKLPLTAAVMLAAIGMIAPAHSAWANDSSEHHSNHSRMMNTDDPHAHHQHMMTDETKHSMEHYELPKVKLVRDDGKSVFLTEELNDGRPVIMNFIFTSCTTICPVISRTFSGIQDELGSERDKVHIVSISIDPEQDTPPVLRKYASKYGAGPEWNFYTGTAAASIAVQQAFDVYRGDKMDQPPVTFLRAAPGQPWLRINGFATAGDLLQDYRALISLKSFRPNQ
ncbi:MAG: SCO family protein [Gallionella sp.]|jgi:protein SCO1/2